jgi:NTP pyrophosphatase (non-canonical NTP hydrolase)
MTMPNVSHEYGRSITDWMDICYHDSHRAGWWEGVDPKSPDAQAVKIALIHSEISEALEGIRKGKQDDHLPDRLAIEVELADALIRIFDLAGSMGLDLEGAVIEKAEYNRHREDHKRDVRKAAGGKKF